MKRILTVAAVLALGVGAFTFLRGDHVQAAGLFKPDDQAVVALGQRLYGENCASCHGENLEGQPNWRVPNADGKRPAPPHDATGHTWHHPDEQLFAITKQGTAALVGNGYQSDMRGYGDDLSDDEIIAILSYIKSTWPDDIRAMHDEMNAQ